MIGLDTNVLARYLIKDDKNQGAMAATLIKGGDTFFINLVVLCELVWVLESNYGSPKKSIVTTLEELLATEQLVIEKSEMVHKALNRYINSSADFSDCLIGLINESADCRHTVSFDRRTKSLATFKALK